MYAIYLSAQSRFLILPEQFEISGEPPKAWNVDCCTK